jgi:hypothetical protein
MKMFLSTMRDVGADLARDVQDRRMATSNVVVESPSKITILRKSLRSAPVID